MPRKISLEKSWLVSDDQLIRMVAAILVFFLQYFSVVSHSVGPMLPQTDVDLFYIYQMVLDCVSFSDTTSSIAQLELLCCSFNKVAAAYSKRGIWQSKGYSTLSKISLRDRLVKSDNAPHHDIYAIRQRKRMDGNRHILLIETNLSFNIGRNKFKPAL